MTNRITMEVSVNELRDRADELELELLGISPHLGRLLLTKKCQVVLINKNDTSDQWKFE